MPEISTKDYSRFYEAHGCELVIQPGGVQAVGECRNCGKERKFHVNCQTGQFSCKSCQFGVNGGGNAVTFLRHLHEVSRIPKSEGEKLRRSRRLLSGDTLEKWGVVQSAYTREWLVPAYNSEGLLSNLYRYVMDKVKNRMVLYSSPEMHKQLFGMSLWDADKPEVYITEGPWDGMALWECLQIARKAPSLAGKGEGGLSITNNPEISLGASANVLSVPGAAIWNDTKTSGWGKLCSGKKVILYYDNDHPLEREGRVIEGAAYSGMKRVVSNLMQMENPPESISFVRWGEGETDWNPDLKTGWDLRDHLTQEESKASRVESLKTLLDLVVPVPESWSVGRSVRAYGGTKALDLIKCESWTDLLAQWKKAIHMIEGLERALVGMLACCMSTLLHSDQLWLKIIGPPSCGKSCLCDALLTNLEFTKSVSKFTGFHSGWKTDKEGKENHSLIHKLRGKTMITKDADTLIQNPNLAELMSEFRDVYDSKSSAMYKNGISRDESGAYITVILCGTETIRALDESDAGQRFIDIVVLDEITEKIERPILQSMFNKFLASRGVEKTSEAESQDNEDMVRAKAMTGGYLQYLRRNAPTLSKIPKFESSAEQTLMNLSKFTAFMRARPSVQKEEFVQREMGGRLLNQFCKLAECSAAVLQKESIDDEVLRFVRQTALDTSRGNTLKMMDKLVYLEEKPRQGLQPETLRVALGMTRLLFSSISTYLVKLKVLEVYRDEGVGDRGVKRLRMTPSFYALYNSVRGAK